LLFLVFVVELLIGKLLVQAAAAAIDSLGFGDVELFHGFVSF
jgi:hypothetical protein